MLQFDQIYLHYFANSAFTPGSFWRLNDLIYFLFWTPLEIAYSRNPLANWFIGYEGMYSPYGLVQYEKHMNVLIKRNKLHSPFGLVQHKYTFGYFNRFYIKPNIYLAG